MGEATNFRILEFQFLLGRLETGGPPCQGFSIAGFQFLLGRLETKQRRHH